MTLASWPLWTWDWIRMAMITSHLFDHSQFRWSCCWKPSKTVENGHIKFWETGISSKWTDEIPLLHFSSYSARKNKKLRRQIQMHPGGPRLDAATAIIAATFGHWRRKVAAATAIIAAMLGHWRQAACCLPCLLSKAPGHLSLQLSPLAMGPAPALGG